MKELTKDFEKHMKGNVYKNSGKGVFEKTMDKIVKGKGKKKGDC